MAGRDSVEMAKVDSAVDTISDLNNEFYKIIVPQFFKPTDDKVISQIKRKYPS